MNPTILTALFAFLPVLALLAGALLLFSKHKTYSSLFQLIGAVCLLLVVLTHLCEATNLLPWMRWGDPHSIGHYLDLASALLGVTLFPLGYLLHVLSSRSA